MNQCQSCMFDDSYYTEEEYLEELRQALSIFDEPDIDDDDEENIEDVIVWAS